MVLLRMLQKRHDDHPNLREYLDKSVVDICGEENISPHQVIFIVFVFAITYDLLCFAMLLQTKT